MSSPQVLNGLDVLARDGFQPLRGHRVALLCNQASIDARLQHVLDLMLASHRAGLFEIAAVFGPQHGLWGHQQDNMIEWEGFTDPRTGLTVHSLYGFRREPAPGSLAGVDTFIVDLQGVGARCYTFMWTMALCLRACAAQAIPVLVLDRPNPLGGLRVEGPVLREEFASFIGLHPLPMRHGLTIGEIARYLREAFWPESDLEVIRVEGWERRMRFEETGLVWAVPSPNMPTPDTATVYPGTVLIEGTNMSEGRGTTRPFEQFGAPWIDGWALCERLNALDLPGVCFRPVMFEPTFDEHAGTVCGGAFVHVLDAEAFEPVLTGYAILRETARLYPHTFQWRTPPFEYVADRMPIDILAGNKWLRAAVEDYTPLPEVRDRMAAESAAFEPTRQAALLYSDG